MVQAICIVFSHCIFVMREFHLTDIHHVVCPVYEHVYLCTFPSVGTRSHSPCKYVGHNSADAKCHFDLANMLETQTLKDQILSLPIIIIYLVLRAKEKILIKCRNL